MAFLLFICKQSTLAMSNIAAPRERVLLLETPVVALRQFVSGSPQGVSCHCIGYHDSVFVCLTTHPGTVPALAMKQYFLEAFEDMKLAATVV
eukprot:TRINITY_DN7455_c0_g2_i1.p2 TRINITY_DN7455_c0_g2~~TRINITY_DN7455_c0_g2_i1.p2  ORF type:complete len:102 (-),score=16.98 TRINITY_DN7455_c0_g2_i1:159-434(-)